MSDPDNLLPADKKWILNERDLEEGDIFPLGNGKRAEYDGRKFVIKKNGQVLGRINVPNRSRKRR